MRYYQYHWLANIYPLNAVNSALIRRRLCSAEAKVTGGSRALGMAALGLKRKAREVLIWYAEDSLMK